MSEHYDPERILTEALALRAAAEQASANMRAEYLAMAERLEKLVQRSTETPAVTE